MKFLLPRWSLVGQWLREAEEDRNRDARLVCRGGVKVRCSSLVLASRSLPALRSGLAEARAASESTSEATVIMMPDFR